MEARKLILEADGIKAKQNMNQTQWSTKAGHATNGQTVSRIISNGDCRLSTFIALLEALGCELVIKEKKNERTED